MAGQLTLRCLETATIESHRLESVELQCMSTVGFEPTRREHVPCECCVAVCVLHAVLPARRCKPDHLFGIEYTVENNAAARVGETACWARCALFVKQLSVMHCKRCVEIIRCRREHDVNDACLMLNPNMIACLRRSI